MNIALVQAVDKATHIRQGSTVTPIKSVWKSIGLHLAINANAHGVCAYSPPAAIVAATRREHSRIRREIRTLQNMGALTRKSGAGGSRKAHSTYTLNRAAWVVVKESLPRGAAHGVPRGAAHGVTVKASVRASEAGVGIGKVGLEMGPAHGVKSGPAESTTERSPALWTRADVRAVDALLRTLDPGLDREAAPGLLADVRAYNARATAQHVITLITQELVSMRRWKPKRPVGWVRYIVPRLVNTSEFEGWAAELDKRNAHGVRPLPKMLTDEARSALIRHWGAKENRL